MPVKDSSVPSPSELLRRLMMLLAGGMNPSVFFGEDCWNCAMEFPEDFLCSVGGISFAGLCSASLVLVF